MAAILPAMSSRGVALVRTARSFFDALADHAKTHPGEASDIMAAVAGHVRSAAPMAMLDTGPVARLEPEPEPVDAVEIELADGSHLRISSESGCTVLHLLDHEEDKAVATFTPIEAVRFRHDFGRVAAKGGGR